MKTFSLEKKKISSSWEYLKQRPETKEKVSKEYLKRTRNLLEIKLRFEKSHQKNTHQNNPLCKILWTILKMKGEIQMNKRKVKKLMTMYNTSQSRDDEVCVKKRRWKRTRQNWGLCRCHSSRIRRIYKKEQRKINYWSFY